MPPLQEFRLELSSWASAARSPNCVIACSICVARSPTRRLSPSSCGPAARPIPIRSLHYRMHRLRIGIGLAAGPQLDGLSRRVGDLATQIEQAMTQLGERAALAHELSSSLNS